LFEIDIFYWINSIIVLVVISYFSLINQFLHRDYYQYPCTIFLGTVFHWHRWMSKGTKTNVRLPWMFLYKRGFLPPEGFQPLKWN